MGEEEEADVVAHQDRGEQNGRRKFIDKLLGEGARLALVAVLTLIGAYLALHREDVNLRLDLRTHESLVSGEIITLQGMDRRLCLELNSVRANQQTVLLSLLGLIDVLEDRTSASLQPVPRTLRTQVFQALGNLPDQRRC